MQKPVYLLKPEVGARRIAKIWMQSWSGLFAYLIAALIGWWWPIIGLGLMIALFALWTLMSVDHGGALSDPVASDHQ